MAGDGVQQFPGDVRGDGEEAGEFVGGDGPADALLVLADGEAGGGDQVSRDR